MFQPAGRLWKALATVEAVDQRETELKADSDTAVGGTDALALGQT